MSNNRQELLNNGTAVGPQGEGMDSPSRFPRYPAYKDSGVEWLGEVPEHWSVLPVKLVGWLKGGAGFPHDKQGFDSHELDFHKVNALASADGEGVLRPSENTVSRETAKELGAYVFPKGTVVFAKVGAALLLGRLRTISAESCIDNNMMGFIAAQEKVSKQFVLYSMSTIRFDLIANPGAVPSLNEGQIGNYRLAIPCLSEQTQIARFLDHETGRIDALIAEQQRLIELLKEKRQAVISHAVTKGLDPTVPMKDSGVEWLGEVPVHWVVSKIGFRARLQGGFAFSADMFTAVGVPIVKMNNLKRGALELSEAAYVGEEFCDDRFALHVGDVLFGMSGSIGPTGSLGNYAVVSEYDIPAMLNQRVGRFVLNSEEVHSGFMMCVLCSRHFNEQVQLLVTGTAQFNISSEQVQSCLSVFPPVHEQAQIARFLEQETSRFDTLLSEAESGIAFLNERRSALISAAVTGKIDVRGWQPPADTGSASTRGVG